MTPRSGNNGTHIRHEPITDPKPDCGVNSETGKVMDYRPRKSDSEAGCCCFSTAKGYPNKEGSQKLTVSNPGP